MDFDEREGACLSVTGAPVQGDVVPVQVTLPAGPPKELARSMLDHRSWTVCCPVVEHVLDIGRCLPPRRPVRRVGSNCAVAQEFRRDCVSTTISLQRREGL